MHRSLGSVYAFKSEIDTWRHTAQLRRPESPRSSAAGAITSIVVLPFSNLSPDPENEYFADGLTDEVIQDLSKIRSLRVISRTSSMVLKGTNKDLKTIGRELGVGFVVEGTVRRAASRLRISARLIDASTDDHLWSGQYDGTVEDVFAIQERLARTIVGALQLQLTAVEHQQLAARPITRPSCVRMLSAGATSGVPMAPGRHRSRRTAPAQRPEYRWRERRTARGPGARVPSVPRSRPRLERSAASRGRELRRKGVRARAGVRFRDTAAWLDSLFERPDPGSRPRFESGA